MPGPRGESRAARRARERRSAAARPSALASARPRPLRAADASLVCAVLALLLAALGGGMLSDRPASLAPDITGPFALIAVPLALLLAGASLVLAFLGPPPASAPAPCRPRSSATAAFALLAALGVASAVASRYPHMSATTLALLVGPIALGWAVARAARTPGGLTAILLAVAAAAAIVAVIGLNEYMRSWRAQNSIWRVFATFAVPNFLAGYLLLALPVTLALFLSLRERNLVVLSGTALVLQLLCLLLTQSRLGVAALAAGMAVFAGLALWSRAIAGHARRRALVIAVLVVLAGLAGARPLLARLRASGDQAYSARFRVLTWEGAVRMAGAHPLLGAGLGTFEATYPPYAVVGFTRHAHNSYLQLAAEAGMPAAALLGLGLLAVALAGVFALRAERRSDGPPLPAAAVDRRLALVGLVSAVAAAGIHSLFDSDLYVPAIGLTLGALCGAVMAASGPPAGAVSEAHAAPGRRFGRGAAFAAAVYLVAIAWIVAAGRMQAHQAEAAIRAGDLEGAIRDYRSATSSDSANAEYHMSLASLYAAAGRPAEARAEQREAVRLSPSGKALYRMGKLLAEQGDHGGAITWYERARAADPHNLRTLLALADSLSALGRHEGALQVYRDMAALYRGPVGRIRAVPEIVEWEYSEAFLGLAEAELARGDRPGAEKDLREGIAILSEYWRTRDSEMAQVAPGGPAGEKTAERYAWALEQWERVLRTLGRPAEADAAAERLRELRAEMAAGASP
ncbi:MAG: O-antigen ligase family protein [Chthonomonadales bacterium]|nr:O-antigen ligase family protein [Chthonomonadales bacterium]